jgi:apolipoprotein D and lipocalin family protein
MMKLIILLLILGLAAGCAKNHNTVSSVDLERFMGDWYVIAILPNPIEKNAANGIESYILKPDGTIGITYKFRKGSPTGKEKVLTPRAKVYNTKTKAEWRVQMFKPFWSPYLVIDLAEDYRYTVIGFPNRKFVWVMSRTPEISESDYANILANLVKEGYKTDKLVKMPQIW